MIMRAFLAGLGACGLMAGCATPRPDVRTAGAVVPVDATHFLVLGFGIISVETTKSPVAAQVLSGRVLGLQLSDQPGLKLSIGYANGQTVLVPAELADDVRLEAIRVDGTVKIKVSSARLKSNFLP
jgi:hypothetical protein